MPPAGTVLNRRLRRPIRRRDTDVPRPALADDTAPLVDPAGAGKDAMDRYEEFAGSAREKIDGIWADRTALELSTDRAGTQLDRDY
jgi:hypothetical protein